MKLHLAGVICFFTGLLVFGATVAMELMHIRPFDI